LRKGQDRLKQVFPGGGGRRGLAWLLGFPVRLYGAA
jgi:hypothetical protein